MTRVLKNSFLILLSLTFLSPVLVSAYNIIPLADISVRGDFVMSPAKVDLFVTPGMVRQVTLYVTNRMGREATFALSVEDARGDATEAVILLGNDRGPYSIKDFVSFSEKTFVLKHGEQVAIPVSIEVPEDATPGGMYGSVVVSTRNEATQIGSGAIVQSRLAALFLVRVSGEVEERGEVMAFDTLNSKRLFFSSVVPKFFVTYRNEGKVHLNPYGGIDIESILGSPKSITIEPWFVLPGSTRTRVIEGIDRLRFGRFTAILNLNKGYGDEVVQEKVTFWVVPKTVWLVLLVLISLPFWLWYRKRQRIRIE